MIRSYLVLAMAGSLLLLTAFATGLAATSAPQGPVTAWRGIHRLASVGTVIAVLGIHAIVYTYFTTTVRRAGELSQAYGLPDWLVGQARRNKGRASRFILGGVAAVAVAAWMGAVIDIRGGTQVRWHLVVSSFALGFNAVAFLIEYAGIVTHHRLLAELKAQADCMRGGDLGADPQAAATEILA